MDQLLQTKYRRKYVTNNGRQLIRRNDLGEGRWDAQSDRHEQLWYLVTMNAEQQYCTCPDFQYRSQICKHMKRVMEVSS